MPQHDRHPQRPPRHAPVPSRASAPSPSDHSRRNAIVETIARHVVQYATQQQRQHSGSSSSSSSSSRRSHRAGSHRETSDIAKILLGQVLQFLVQKYLAGRAAKRAAQESAASATASASASSSSSSASPRGVGQPATAPRREGLRRQVRSDGLAASGTASVPGRDSTRDLTHALENLLARVHEVEDAIRTEHHGGRSSRDGRRDTGRQNGRTAMRGLEIERAWDALRAAAQQAQRLLDMVQRNEQSGSGI